MGSDEDLGEGEGCLVGKEKVGEETDGSSPAFKQAQRVVGSPRGSDGGRSTIRNISVFVKIFQKY